MNKPQKQQKIFGLLLIAIMTLGYVKTMRFKDVKDDTNLSLDFNTPKEFVVDIYGNTAVPEDLAYADLCTKIEITITNTPMRSISLKCKKCAGSYVPIKDWVDVKEYFDDNTEIAFTHIDDACAISQPFGNVEAVTEYPSNYNSGAKTVSELSDLGKRFIDEKKACPLFFITCKAKEVMAGKASATNPVFHKIIPPYLQFNCKVYCDEYQTLLKGVKPQKFSITTIEEGDIKIDYNPKCPDSSSLNAPPKNN